MKKVLVALVVLTMVCLGSMAFAAADVSVGGSVQIRSRDFDNLRFSNTDPSGSYADTQERVELDVNVKAGDDVKGKIALWNDFNDWGTIEQQQGNGFGNSLSSSPAADHFGFREAWVNFNVPGIPVNVTAGHQLLALNQGWFLRNKHFGDDAWVIANVTGPNTAAFVNIVAQKNNAAEADSAVDAYALLDVFKIDDSNMVMVDLSYVKAGLSSVVPYPPLGSAVAEFPNIAGSNLYNLGLGYTGKIGPLNLKVEADAQAGKLENPATSEPKFEGNQIVIQGNVALDPVTIEFTLARGSGTKQPSTLVGAPGGPNVGQYINFLDVDPHYTFLYEYKTITAAGARNTGFANTTAASIGANANVSKSVNIGLDVWYLLATQKESTPLANATNDTGSPSNYVGTEVDATINWKLYDNLTWNWNLGWFKPGSCMSAPRVADSTSTAVAGSVEGMTHYITGIQGILSLNF